MNQFNPVKIELENIKIDIPEIVQEIKIETHPFLKYIDDLFDNNVSILGINSEFITSIPDKSWSTYNITDKWKQPKLAKIVKSLGSHFNVLLYNSKYPAWDLFNHVPFDIIFLETQKNYDQMSSIILGSKDNKYINVKGIFVREEFLSK